MPAEVAARTDRMVSRARAAPGTCWCSQAGISLPQRTAGVDVERTFVAEPLTVLFGSGRTPSKGSGFVRHKPARRRSVNPCLGGELAGRLLQTVLEAVQRPIERARQPVVAQRV